MFEHLSSAAAPRIVGSATELPPHRYDQEELLQVATMLLPDLAVERATLRRLFRRMGVRARYLALPAAQYAGLDGLQARNAAWLRSSLELGQNAVQAALDDAGLGADQVQLFATTTVTGIAVPSLDARLSNQLGFSSQVRRLPLFGLGCMAGAAGIARVADYLRAYPSHAAVFLAVELCSLTLQREDVSVANLISTGLFGDGAAAVVLVGAEHPLAQKNGLKVRDSLSILFPHTERTMGWDIVDSGFKIVLSAEVPNIARRGLPDLARELLQRNGAWPSDVQRWIAHPGGPAVIRAMLQGLELEPHALEPTRRCLEEVGNLSSASVLFLLDEFRRQPQDMVSQRLAVLLAMGPGFSAEGVLLEC